MKMLLTLVIMVPFHLSVITTMASTVHKSKRSALNIICHEAIFNRTKVQKCPSDEEEARVRSKTKKCDNYQPCNGKILVYHCARDNDNLMEACAPIETILGFCCPQYNVGVGRVIANFKEHCPECPFKYYSNESWKYPSCVRYSEGTPVPEQDSERTSATTFNNSCENVTLPRGNCKSRSVEENDNSKRTLAIVLLVIIIPAGLLGMFMILLKLFPKAKDKLANCIRCLKTQNIGEIEEQHDFIQRQNKIE